MNRAQLLWIVLAVIGGGLILLIVNDSSGSTLGMPNGSFASPFTSIATATFICARD